MRTCCQSMQACTARTVPHRIMVTQQRVLQNREQRLCRQTHRSDGRNQATRGLPAPAFTHSQGSHGLLAASANTGRCDCWAGRSSDDWRACLLPPGSRLRTAEGIQPATTLVRCSTPPAPCFMLRLQPCPIGAGNRLDCPGHPARLIRQESQLGKGHVGARLSQSERSRQDGRTLAAGKRRHAQQDEAPRKQAHELQRQRGGHGLAQPQHAHQHACAPDRNGSACSR